MEDAKIGVGAVGEAFGRLTDQVAAEEQIPSDGKLPGNLWKVGVGIGGAECIDYAEPDVAVAVHLGDVETADGFGMLHQGVDLTLREGRNGPPVDDVVLSAVV